MESENVLCNSEMISSSCNLRIVVVTLSFDAMIDLSNFECNLKTRDSRKWPCKGNIEGADLK